MTRFEYAYGVRACSRAPELMKQHSTQTCTPATECRAKGTYVDPIHVPNGTPVGNVSLCHTCRHPHIQHGYADSEEQVLCGYLDEQVRPVQFMVRTCTDYPSKLVKTVYEMEKVAFILDAKRITKRRSVGFGETRLGTRLYRLNFDTPREFPTHEGDLAAILSAEEALRRWCRRSRPPRSPRWLSKRASACICVTCRCCWCGTSRVPSAAGRSDSRARHPACRRARRIRRHLLEARQAAALGAGKEGDLPRRS
jgi:hypothetical protein